MALTNEDLLAISNLLDIKLKPMDAKIDRLDEKVNGLDEKVNGLDEKVNRLDERVSRLEGRVASVEADSKGIRLLLENKVLPRLQNIEAGVGDGVKGCHVKWNMERVSCRVQSMNSAVFILHSNLYWNEEVKK